MQSQYTLDHYPDRIKVLSLQNTKKKKARNRMVGEGRRAPLRNKFGLDLVSRPQKAAMFWNKHSKVPAAERRTWNPILMNLSSLAKEAFCSKRKESKSPGQVLPELATFPQRDNQSVDGYKRRVQLSSIFLSFSSHFIPFSSHTHSPHQPHQHQLHHQPCLSEESQSSTPVPPFPTSGKPSKVTPSSRGGLHAYF